MSHKGRLYSLALVLGMMALAVCLTPTSAGATSRQGTATLPPVAPATDASPWLHSSAAPRAIAPQDITVSSGSSATSCSRLSAVGTGTPGQYAAVRVYNGSVSSGTPLIDSFTDKTSQGAGTSYTQIASDGTFHVEAAFTAQPAGTMIQYVIYDAPSNTYGSYDGGAIFNTTVASCTPQAPINVSSATTYCSLFAAHGTGTPGQYAAVEVLSGGSTPLIQSFSNVGAPTYYALIGSDGTFNVTAPFAAQPAGSMIQYVIYDAPLNTFGSYDSGSGTYNTTVACTQDPATPAAQTAAAQTAAAQTASAIPTSTSTSTPTSSSTSTPTSSSTSTSTSTPVATGTSTPPPTATTTPVPTNTATAASTATPTATPTSTATPTATSTALPGSGGGAGTGNVSGPVVIVSGNGNVVIVVVNYNGVATGNGVIISGPVGASPPPAGTPTAATPSRTPSPTKTPTAAALPTRTAVRDSARATPKHNAAGHVSHGVVVGGGTLLVRLRVPRGALTPGAPVAVTIELVAAPAPRVASSRAARAVLYQVTVHAWSSRGGLLRARVRVGFKPRRAVAATLIVRVHTPHRLLISRTAVMVVPAR